MNSRFRWYSLAFIVLFATAIVFTLKSTKSPEFGVGSQTTPDSPDITESPVASPSPLPSPSIAASPTPVPEEYVPPEPYYLPEPEYAPPVPSTSNESSTYEEPPAYAEPAYVEPAQSAPTPTPLSADEIAAVAVEQARRNLQEGQIAWNPPKQMQVHETGVITARISKDLEQNITSGLDGNPITANIAISTFVEVNLLGEDFEIESQTPDKQVVLDGAVAEWQWKVTPQKKGDRTLTLKVYARVKLSETQEEVFEIKTYEQPVTVKVTTSTFIGDNWQWLADNAEAMLALTAIATGVGTFAATRWKQIEKWVQSRASRKSS